VINAQATPKDLNVQLEDITKRNVSVSWLISALKTPPELRALIIIKTYVNAKMLNAREILIIRVNMAMILRHAHVNNLAEER